MRTEELFPQAADRHEIETQKIEVGPLVLAVYRDPVGNISADWLMVDGESIGFFAIEIGEA